MRVIALQLLDQTRQDIKHGRRNRADGQHPRLPRHRLLHGEFQPLQLVRELAHGRQNRRPHRGQLRTASRAIKQLDLERLLQHLDLLAQRWLGHAQTLGRSAEILFFGNSQEQPKVPYQTKIDHN
ncbi:hypothetical protein D3C84_1053550 [compost metagenome]